MPENRHRGTTLDSLLADEGVLAEFQAEAIKEVVVWQTADADAEADAEDRPSDA